MSYRKSTKYKSKISQKTVFSTGAVLFVIGFLGMVYSLWFGNNEFSEFLPQETVFWAEFKVEKSLQKKEFGLSDFIKNVMEEKFPLISFDNLSNWLGDEINIACIRNDEFIVAAKYWDKSEAMKFVKSFLVENEELKTREINNLKVYSPAFSSNLQFVFYKKWLIMSDYSSLDKIAKSQKKLFQKQSFRKIFKDLPKSKIAKIYVEPSYLSQSDGNLIKNQTLFKIIEKNIPAAGFIINEKQGNLHLNSKILTSEGLFSSEILKNTPNEIVPELSQYSPQDVLFFMNGFDLKKKYEHTKSFLEEFDPQFSLIFDGILRAEGKRIFGENFDFQSDLIDKLSSQYSIVSNFKDQNNPLPYFTIITGFGQGNTEINSQALKEIIANAQKQFSTKLITKKLADGSKREELIMVDDSEIEIIEKKISDENKNSYFVAQTKIKNSEENPALPNKKFSYGFLNNLLIFSTQEEGVKEVFKAYQEENLTENNDFRENVLFNFPSSESFGFINSNKLANLINFWPKINSTKHQYATDFSLFLQNFRNISFARKTLPNEIIFSAVINKR